MHHMTFVEESEVPTEMSVFPNDNGKVCIEIHPRGDDYDLYQYQNIALGKADIVALINDLQRILKSYELVD